MGRSPLKWPWKLLALRSHLQLWQHGELSCEGIGAVPEHSSHALREMPSAGCSRCKVCSTCAWHTHHLSPTREINAWWAQHKLSMGLWAPEYLLMDLLQKCVPVQCLGSYSSVTARHRYRCTWGTKLFPLWDTFLTPLCFFLMANVILKPQWNFFMSLFPSKVHPENGYRLSSSHRWPSLLAGPRPLWARSGWPQACSSELDFCTYCNHKPFWRNSAFNRNASRAHSV